MAAIAKRARRPLLVVSRKKRHPPVGPVRDKVGFPRFVDDVPLRAEREVVVAALFKVALFPDASVNEGDLLLLERRDFVRREVRDDRFGMLVRIAHHIGHWSFFPARIDFGVALFASARADIMTVCRGL